MNISVAGQVRYYLGDQILDIPVCESRELHGTSMLSEMHVPEQGFPLMEREEAHLTIG
jgi:hypothetical protein